MVAPGGRETGGKGQGRLPTKFQGRGKEGFKGEGRAFKDQPRDRTAIAAAQDCRNNKRKTVTKVGECGASACPSRKGEKKGGEKRKKKG